jgi:hypothetical protein
MPELLQLEAFDGVGHVALEHLRLQLAGSQRRIFWR